MDIETIVQEYKSVYIQIQALEQRQNELKDQLLKETKEQEGEWFGLQLKRVEGSSTIDWARFRANFGIKDESLEPFKKERPGYWRFIIQKTMFI